MNLYSHLSLMFYLLVDCNCKLQDRFLVWVVKMCLIHKIIAGLLPEGNSWIVLLRYLSLPPQLTNWSVSPDSPCPPLRWWHFSVLTLVAFLVGFHRDLDFGFMHTHQRLLSLSET